MSSCKSREDNISFEADFLIVLLPLFVFLSHPSSLISTAIIIVIVAFFHFVSGSLKGTNDSKRKTEREGVKRLSVSGFLVTCLQRCWS